MPTAAALRLRHETESRRLGSIPAQEGRTMIQKMTSDEEIVLTFDVMRQLRTHLSADRYLETVRRQQETNNYNLAAVIEDGVVQCVAGYRIAECLSWSKFLYVDDLVTDVNTRSHNCGKQLIAWLADEAKENGCAQLHLDSGVQRHAAHRFYLRERMDITCYHFQMAV
jgi:GNAT superfamily N-acetyltransferase